MKRLHGILFALVAFLVATSATGNERTGGSPARSGAVMRQRDDAILLRLHPHAARLRRALDSTHERALPALGLPGIDGAAARIGPVRFEREFVGEPPAELAAGGVGDLTVYWIVHLPVGTAVDDALAAFQAAPEVEAAARIAVVPVEAVPNDSLWSDAHHLYQPARRDIHAVEAWDVTTGDTSLIVAIIDTGILRSHPDLGGRSAGQAGQLWTNPLERHGAPGIDDDGNGFVDDEWGWDFVNLRSAEEAWPGEDWRDPDPDPNDFVGHGTAVAGLVGAATNNGIGVAGTVWSVRLMALRAGWSSSRRASGEIDLSYVARAIRYATRMGASVINCSFSTVYQMDLADAVSEATRRGVVVVTAAGNYGSFHYLADRNDVISVAATDPDDRIAPFSNRGPYVDLAAPGTALVTTSITRPGTDSLGLRQAAYTRGASGTSFSAPLVAGAAVLLQSQRLARGAQPLRPLQIHLRLTDCADDLAETNPGVLGYGSGRLNLFRALTDPPTSFAASARGRTVGPGVVLPTASGGFRIAVATADGRVLVMDGGSGGLHRVAVLPAAPQGGLAAADLGTPTGLGLFVATIDAWIHGFDAEARALPGWPVQATQSRTGERSEPALGDLDGDGTLEVVWGGHDGRVWAWHADGRLVTGFPFFVDAHPERLRIALSDLDERPGVEIVALSGSGGLYALNAQGRPRVQWTLPLEGLASAVAIGHLGAAGTPTILVAGGPRVWAIESGGTLRWARRPRGFQIEDLALADLDGDGSDEIILTRTLPVEIAVLDSAGRPFRPEAWPRALPGLTAGTPVVGPLGAGGRIAVLQPLHHLGLVAFDVEGASLPAFPKPGGAGAAPSLADLDHDGRTEILAGSGTDSSILVYDAGPGTWREASGIWPTGRGNHARTGSSRYAPPPQPVDDLAPEPVTDLSAVPLGGSRVEIRWSVPVDRGSGRLERYELRHARFPIEPGNFDGAEEVGGVPVPGVVGSIQRMSASGFEENTTYHFALRSHDRAGNMSPLSNRASTAIAGIPPAAVADLRVVGASDTSLALSWTATGDDGRAGRPRLYRIHGADTPLTAERFGAAPLALTVESTVEAGSPESASLAGLQRGRRYWIALEAEDDMGNRSAISNVVSAVVGPLAARTGMALLAVPQPAAPPIAIHWQGAASGTSRSHEIGIYDVAGRRVRRMTVEGGEGMMMWDGCGDDGTRLPPGLFFARLWDRDGRSEARILLLR